MSRQEYKNPISVSVRFEDESIEHFTLDEQPIMLYAVRPDNTALELFQGRLADMLSMCSSMIADLSEQTDFPAPLIVKMLAQGVASEPLADILQKMGATDHDA